MEPEPRAFARFSSAKIKGDMLSRFPHLKERLQGWDEHFKAGKGLVFLHPDFTDRMIRSFPVLALVIPRVKRCEQASLHPAYLNAHREMWIVRSMVQMFEVRDGKVNAIEAPWHGPNLGRALFRRKAFEIVGSFDESMRLGEDLDWFLRASERGVSQHWLPDIALSYRKHDDNICLGRPHLRNPKIGAIKKHLDRMRDASLSTE